MPYLNSTGVDLSVAVFLATDDYDHNPSAISATTLLKSTRQQVLTQRVSLEESAIDIISLVKSRMGTAIHNGIEEAWKKNYRKAMLSLRYPENLINRIVINPDPDDMAPDAIPVYMEQRAYREFEGKKLSGKYDFVLEGQLEDFKTTSVYTWVHDTKDEDYILQGSIYRWLNPKVITADTMKIQFIFTDWSAIRAMTDTNYPDQPIKSKTYNLMSFDEVEHYIRTKLIEYERCKDLDESAIPKCNDKELWRKDPIYKYYKNPAKMARATKNFTSQQEAYVRLAEDGGVGTVIEIPGEVVACKYCAAFTECSQKDELMANGSLQI